MKRVILIGILAVFGLSLMAAAPLVRNFSVRVTGSTTVDSQFTADAWDSITNIIPIADDSANVIITVTGTVILTGRSVLYLGMSALDADSLPELDTIIVRVDEGRRVHNARVTFTMTFPKLNDGALTDTIYILAATGGSGRGEGVTIEDLVVTALVADQ